MLFLSLVAYQYSMYSCDQGQSCFVEQTVVSVGWWNITTYFRDPNCCVF